MNSYEQQKAKMHNLCDKCKYKSCIYEISKGSLDCPTWCKNHLKGTKDNCRCIKYMWSDDSTCEYFEKGKALSDDELIDKENADYKRYIRIAKRRNFDDA